MENSRRKNEAVREKIAGEQQVSACFAILGPARVHLSCPRGLSAAQDSQTYLDIEVDDVLVVDKDESLQELSGEADDVTFIGHHVLVEQSLQVAAGTAGEGEERRRLIELAGHSSTDKTI